MLTEEVAGAPGPAPEADDASDSVSRWRAGLMAHPALTALATFNERLASGGELRADVARAFVCSLYAFNRATPAGIVHLAGRWTDALALRNPLSAHRIASRVLAAAVDEFGLTGTRSHVELFMAFAGRWGIAPEVVLDARHAVPAARELGACVDGWYRSAPLTDSLTVHFVSEETSAAEFRAWGPIFPDAEYIDVHARLEPGHSSDAADALELHLSEYPDAIERAERCIEPYLRLYGAMWEQLLMIAMSAGEAR